MPAPSNPFQPYADKHKNLQGIGDARPTALQIVQDLDLVNKLQDKVIFITGASAGLGIETARALHATGAKLFLTFRNQAKGEAVVKDLVDSNPTGQTPELIELDLASFESVKKAAKQFLGRSEQLNILVNNAGIMAVPEGRTVDGLEMQIGSNHFGHFLLFQLLKPTLLASATSDFPSRVVNLSSAGHKGSGVHLDDLDLTKQGYDAFVAYGQSKTANIYMANSIDRHYGSRGLRGLSVHPGLIFTTDLGRSMDPALLESFKAMAFMAKSAEQGAATTVWAALSPHFNDKGGVYLSEVGEAGPMKADELIGEGGYAEHAYNEDAEEKLWKLSYETVGIKDNEE